MFSTLLHLVQQCRSDLCGIQEYNPGFPLPEASTTTLNNEYKCYVAPGNEPRVAFLVRNTLVPHVLETLYSPNALAGALRLQLPNSPRRTIAGVYSKFSRHDKQEVDPFLQTFGPYDIMIRVYNDDIWSAGPTRPWQQDLANSVLLDPLHASSQPPEPQQYYTRIPRHGRLRRLDAVLVTQQIPNIPWTCYDTIEMPISDHALVLLRIRWRIGAPNAPFRKPQPSVSKWYTTHFQRFTNSMSTLPVKDTDPPPAHGTAQLVGYRTRHGPDTLNAPGRQPRQHGRKPQTPRRGYGSSVRLKSTTFGGRLASSVERQYTYPVSSTRWSRGGALDSLRKTRHSPELEVHNRS